MTPIIAGIMSIGGSIIERLIPDPQERAKAQLALLEMQQEGEFTLLKQRMSAIVSEANSKDAWTSRARPTFLYVMYSLLLLCIVGSIIGVWYPSEVFIASKNLKLLFAAIPTELYALFGAGYLGYTHYRSSEKKQGVSK